MAGRYIYVGSAWGPGGIAARLGRHIRGDGKPHWHIDYARHVMQPIGAWVAYGRRLECEWATCLASNFDAIVPGFGASDCRCVAHFFYVADVNLQEIQFASAPVFFDLTSLSPVLY